MTLRATPPSFGGNDSYLELGRGRFGLPPGTMVREAHPGKLAYVRLRDGSVHAFVPQGEIPLPDALAALIGQQVFGQTSDV